VAAFSGSTDRSTSADWVTKVGIAAFLWRFCGFGFGFLRLLLRLGFLGVIGIGSQQSLAHDQDWTGPASRWSYMAYVETNWIDFGYEKHARAKAQTGRQPDGVLLFVAICLFVFYYFFLLLNSRPSTERLRMLFYLFCSFVFSRFRVSTIDRGSKIRRITSVRVEIKNEINHGQPTFTWLTLFCP